MKLKHLQANLICLLTLIYLLTGCNGSSKSGIQSVTQPPTPVSKNKQLIAAEFRALLLGQIEQIAEENQAYSPPQLAQISIPLNFDSVNTLFQSINQPQLKLIDDTFRTMQLTDMNSANLHDQAKQFKIDAIKQPITFILIPGVMSEFIKYELYEDIFDKTHATSSFRKMWEQKQRAASKVVDPRLNLNVVNSDQSIGHTDVMLNQLIDVTSIDDAAGNPKIRFIRMKVSFLSLETLGTIKDTAQIYNRRLTKFFRAIGNVMPNIILAGYSRGGAVALEMLSAARKSQPNWFPNVKGMLGIGGVIYGTPSADILFQPAINGVYVNDSQKQIAVINHYFLGTPETPGLTLLDQQKPILHLENLKSILHNAQQYMSAFSILKGEETPSDSEGAANSFLAVMKKIKGMQRQISAIRSSINQTQNSTDFDAMFNNALNAMFEKFNFNITSFFNVQEYNHNIIRFRRLLTAMLSAVKELSTAERLKWWQEHDLPAGMKYFAIAATLDADLNLFQDQITYRSDTESGKGQLNNNVVFRKESGFNLNDGAMPLHRAIFWPQLSAALNPRNKIDATLLGICGTTHYGLALPYALGSKEQGANPFPREALIRAAAITIGQSIAP